MSEDEIRQKAKDFVAKFLSSSDWEMNCHKCGACNCKSNHTCIKCNAVLIKPICKN